MPFKHKWKDGAEHISRATTDERQARGQATLWSWAWFSPDRGLLGTLALLPAVPHASYCAGSGWEESLRHRCDSRSRKVTCITRAGACPGSPDCLWREEKPCSCISRLKTMLFSPTSPDATTQPQRVPVCGSNAAHFSVLPVCPQRAFCI